MRKTLALLWLALVVGAVAHVAVLSRHGLPRETDIMALLPREEREPEIQAAKDRVAKSLSGRVVVMVGHSDRALARAQAQELRRVLVESGLVRPESDIPDQDAVKRLGAAYFGHRAGLLAENDRTLLRNGEGDVLVKRALSQIFGFGGAVDSRLLARDPFLLFPAFLGELPMPANRVVMDEGLPSVAENGKTWVLLSLRISGEAFDLDFQNRFTAGFSTATATAAVSPGTQILRLGAVFFAQAGAEQAMGESARIGLISLAGTVLLLVLTFRSIRPLLLSLAAIGAGLAAALSVCLALFGSLHVAAQMFGAALIGIAVDYALLYFGQTFTPRTDPGQRLAHVLPGIALGAATTIIGYGALALSPFPGLHQVAVFSAVGLAGSFLSVVLWFPLLDRAPAARLNPAWAAAAQGLWRFWSEAGLGRARWLAVLVLALLGGFGLSRLEVDDDMRHQQGLSPILAAEQAEIQRLAGFGQAGRFFLVRGDDVQQVLEREEALDERLTGLTGRQMAARFVPSARRQADNAALVEKALTAPHLAAYRARLGMAGPVETPPTAPLSLDDIRATGGLPFLDALVLDEGMHVVSVDGAADSAILRDAAQGLDGLRFVDPTGDLNLLLESYRRRALMLVAASTFLMVPLLAWRYGARGAVRVMLPAAAAVVLTPPLLALAGLGFSFFGAMALVLVLSIGTDYAVFCAEDRNRDPVTLVSVSLAMLTTLLSFGLLAASEAAAVRAFGATMLVGVALAFLLSPAVRAGLSEARENSAGRR